MPQFAPSRVRIERDVVTLVHRNLKGKGKIFVSQNQQVSPSDIIGTAQISAGFRSLNLADELKVAPGEVQKYMKRSLGQRIYRGELLASRRSFFGGKRDVTSPTDGVLDFLNDKTGEVRMSFLPKKADLPAGVYGVVDMVDQEKGQVAIRTEASIVHGMFGSGKLRDGTLHIISRRDGIIGKSYISPKYDGQVLLGGSLVFKEGISSAISATVSAFITGGINAKDYKGMSGGRLIFPKKLDNDIGLSIIVCEGFGSVPIGDDIYDTLSRYDGRYVSVDGNKALIYLPSFESSSLIKIKNTILPQDDMNEESRPQILEVRLGLKVRIIGNSYLGGQGQIVALDKIETVLPSGIRTFMATVETKRLKVKVPVANLEIIL